MKKEIRILKIVKKCIENSRIQKEALKQEEKRVTLNLLNRTWTNVQIKDYNYALIINSAGWVGGDYTERDIKASILRDSAHLFTEEEYADLYNKIYPKEKIK